MSTHELRDLVSEAHGTGDWSQFEEWIGTESSYIFETGDAARYNLISDDTVDQLLAVMHANGVPAEVRFHIALFFQSEWQLMSDSQRADILPHAREVLLDTTTYEFKVSFALVELLGKCYADRVAFETFLEMAKSADTEQRALACIGISYVGKNTTEPDLARDTVSHLESAMADPDEEVREEALIGLNRLKTPKPSSHREAIWYDSVADADDNSN